MREGLIMPHGNPAGRGIFKHKPGSSPSNKADVKVADFSYQNDELAALIVRAWNDQPAGFQNSLLVGTPVQRMAAAQAALQGLPIHPIGLASPIVITECDNDDQVVFVLPNATRQSGTNLVETAKMLMACVPNGI
jgi:hypothetical protein